MPTITLSLQSPPTFEFDIPQHKLDNMTEEELKHELVTKADIHLAEGASDYDDDDWELTHTQ